MARNSNRRQAGWGVEERERGSEMEGGREGQAERANGSQKSSLDQVHNDNIFGFPLAARGA